MRRLVQDLGDLTGLDIVAAARCAAPVQDAAARSERPPMSVALALGAPRWLSLASAAGGRCRLVRGGDTPEAQTPRLH